MRLKISIAGLMRIVVIAALISSLVVFAVRLQPEPLRVLTAVVLTFVAVAALLSRGRFLAFNLGFAIVGWVYFGLTCVNPIVMPTTRWLAHLYEVVIGSPTVFRHPDDVGLWMHQFANFLRVGHAILALLLGIAAGWVFVALAALFRTLRGKSRVVTSGEWANPPQPPSRSLESSRLVP